MSELITPTSELWVYRYRGVDREDARAVRRLANASEEELRRLPKGPYRLVCWQVTDGQVSPVTFPPSNPGQGDPYVGGEPAEAYEQATRKVRADHNACRRILTPNGGGG